MEEKLSAETQAILLEILEKMKSAVKREGWDEKEVEPFYIAILKSDITVLAKLQKELYMDSQAVRSTIFTWEPDQLIEYEDTFLELAKQVENLRNRLNQ